MKKLAKKQKSLPKFKSSFTRGELELLIQYLGEKKYQLVEDKLRKKLNGAVGGLAAQMALEDKPKPVYPYKYGKDDSLVVASAESNQKKLVDSQTVAEQAMKVILKELGINFIFQHIVYYKQNDRLKYFIVDFFIPKYSAALEVDGGSHTDPKIVKSDLARTHLLKNNSSITEVYRFRNEQVLNKPEGVIKFLSELKALPTLDTESKAYKVRPVKKLRKKIKNM